MAKDIIEKIELYEARSAQFEIDKAFKRLSSFEGNEAKINKRTKTMTDPLKLVIWGQVLEDWNYHHLVDVVWKRYKEITGNDMFKTPEWRQGLRY